MTASAVVRTDPSDRLEAILKRRVAVRTALTVRALASGFARTARARRR